LMIRTVLVITFLVWLAVAAGASLVVPPGR
jgi:hypothetical protein